jgi:hypothetical protein
MQSVLMNPDFIVYEDTLFPPRQIPGICEIETKQSAPHFIPAYI